MAALPLTPALFLFLLLCQALALQVTPNSPCAAVCLDDRTHDVSDPNQSSTRGSDIVCHDSSFSKLAVGEKFESCISCLQNSTFSQSNENDQGWFLYNVRYAVDSCLFGFANTSDPISTPCSTDTSCGHLQTALEDGNLDPSDSTYDYCSADGNAFLGSSLSQCLDCLKVSGDTQYLTNFVISLQAGCIQQPPVGTLIGIQGSVFSPNLVNITYPGYKQDVTSKHKKALSQGAIIGIAVGLAVLTVIIIAVIFIWYRKRHGRNQMKRLTSPLDSRFGAMNITAPNSGSYGHPYVNSSIKEPQKFEPSSLSTKERQVLGLDRPEATRQSSIARSRTPSANDWHDTGSHKDNQLPPYSGSGVPAHQAYISESPVTSIDSNNTFQMSTYSSPRSSPRNKIVPPPPAINVPPSARGFTLVESQAHVPRGGTPSPPYVPRVNTQLPSRTASRSENLRPNTTRYGIGNANASSEIRIGITGEAATHDGRFNFELGERERRERDLNEQRARRKNADLTPESAESEEQWPGSY